MTKRILIYNWAPFDDFMGRGGGISVYLKNIIPLYIESGVKVFFVSSGCHYSLKKRNTFFEETKNIYSHLDVKSYQIVNSPIKAPARQSFSDINNCIDNKEIATVFADLVSLIGDVDECHFHTIEGLSTKVLPVLSKRSNARLITWFHNYHWVCGQRDLLKNDSVKCYDYSDGQDCVGCINETVGVKNRVLIQRLFTWVELKECIDSKYIANLKIAVERAIRVIQWIVRFSLYPFNMLLKNIDPKKLDKLSNIDAKTYRLWREINLNRLTNSSDVYVAVSDLVAEKIKTYGLKSNRIVISPLGMDVYNADYLRLGRSKVRPQHKYLRVAYVGYGTKAKGFDLFCQSLLSLASEYDGTIEIHIVAKLHFSQTKILNSLKKRYKVILTMGYERDNLPRITSNFDVAIVPSIWWETFNQVAYEMIMNGVPVIVSDSVGIATYLNQEFVFKSEDSQSLQGLICKIVDGDITLKDYWHDDAIKLVSLNEHFRRLNTDLNALSSI